CHATVARLSSEHRTALRAGEVPQGSGARAAGHRRLAGERRPETHLVGTGLAARHRPRSSRAGTGAGARQDGGFSPPGCSRVRPSQAWSLPARRALVPSRGFARTKKKRRATARRFFRASCPLQRRVGSYFEMERRNIRSIFSFVASQQDCEACAAASAWLAALCAPLAVDEADLAAALAASAERL